MNKNLLYGNNKNARRRFFYMIDKIALVLSIIGGLNWGLVGIFQFDIVAWIGGGQTGILARIIYILVGLSAIWCVSLLFRDNEISADTSINSHA